MVDGNTYQLDPVHARAHACRAKVTIVVEVVHILEYLWRAAWCSYREGDPAAAQWICISAHQVLAGRAGPKPS